MAFTITALTLCPGVHYWPGATATRDYLAQTHRHLFHVRATVRVGHGNRDVEFHDLGSYVRRALKRCSEPFVNDHALRDFGPASCEAIASSVAAFLTSVGLEVAAVSCSEDDEYTATWTKD